MGARPRAASEPLACKLTLTNNGYARAPHETHYHRIIPIPVWGGVCLLASVFSHHKPGGVVKDDQTTFFFFFFCFFFYLPPPPSSSSTTTTSF